MSGSVALRRSHSRKVADVCSSLKITKPNWEDSHRGFSVGGLGLVQSRHLSTGKSRSSSGHRSCSSCYSFLKSWGLWEIPWRAPSSFFMALVAKQICALPDTPSLCTHELPDLILLLTCESLGSRGSCLTLASLLATVAPQLVFSTWK